MREKIFYVFNEDSNGPGREPRGTTKLKYCGRCVEKGLKMYNVENFFYFFLKVVKIFSKMPREY